jgi:hypothetical protein
MTPGRSGLREAEEMANKKSGGSLVSRVRSAITGRFGGKSTAKRGPKTTGTESTKRRGGKK